MSDADDRAAYTAAARERAFLLYEGVRVPHRSCGIALAETFGLPTATYQALRRGGLTGLGPCGSVAGGLLVLGEILGDPDPAGPPTAALREAATRYRARIAERLAGPVDASCDARTAPHQPFTSPARAAACTDLTATVAETVAEILWDLGHASPLPPPPWEPASETA